MFDGSLLDVAQAVDTKIEGVAVLALVPGTFVDARAGTHGRSRVGRDGRSRDDPDGMLDMHESVRTRMIEGSGTRDVARLTEIKVGAAHAAVAGASDDRFTRVAPVRDCGLDRFALGNARLADAAAVRARKNRTETLRLRSAGRLSGNRRFWLGLWRANGLKGVGHVSVGRLNVLGRVARIAQVKVVAVQALVASAKDLLVARVAPDPFMFIVFWTWRGRVRAWDRLRHFHIITADWSRSTCIG